MMKRTTVFYSLFFVSTLLLLVCYFDGSDAQSSCPNNCSNNGRCLSSGLCACNAGWTGNDCSLPVTSLTPSSPHAVGSVERSQWHYYQYAVSDTSSALVWQVNQTGANAASADCDFYIQFQTFPARDNYLYRDISTNPSVTISIPSPSRGTYIAGVYGWTACSYSISAIQRSPCPAACSGHGTCNSNGLCTCSAGWAGNDCSQAIIPLSAGTALSNQNVQKYQWLYFSFTVRSSTTPITSLTFRVFQDSADSDADLYIKKDEIPTFWNFDQRNDDVLSNFSIEILAPTPGVYYAGVFGFTPCRFTIVAVTQQSCPNSCSGPSHGSCDGSGCACNTGYSGASCEQATYFFSNHQEVAGYVAQGQWNYYQAQALTNQNMQISVFQRGAGDCDIYVKHDVNPTTVSYDYRDVTIAQNFTLTIQNPSNTLWKVGIYGFQECTYTLTGTLSMACPHDCSSHGTCLDTGRCDCFLGWSGDDCSSNITSLSPLAVPINTQIGNGVWHYYTISPVQTAVTIHLFELGGSKGMLWLFVNDNAAPTFTDYDQQSTDTNTKNHNIVIARTHPNDPTSYFIGVYGNPLIPAGHNVPYTLSAFSIPF